MISCTCSLPPNRLTCTALLISLTCAAFLIGRTGGWATISAAISAADGEGLLWQHHAHMCSRALTYFSVVFLVQRVPEFVCLILCRLLWRWKQILSAARGSWILNLSPWQNWSDDYARMRLTWNYRQARVNALQTTSSMDTKCSLWAVFTLWNQSHSVGPFKNLPHYLFQACFFLNSFWKHTYPLKIDHQ